MSQPAASSVYRGMCACAQECLIAQTRVSTRTISRAWSIASVSPRLRRHCWQAAAFMSRGSHSINELCMLCASIAMPAPRMQQARLDHCQRCAEGCRDCATRVRQNDRRQRIMICGKKARHPGAHIDGAELSGASCKRRIAGSLLQKFHGPKGLAWTRNMP